MVDRKETYLATARKWRPLRFEELVGQESVARTLKNAVKTGKIHHAYLFSGPRGVGKTTTARILARALNCENPIDAEPCNKCSSCVSILEGKSLDVVEIDGASNNGVEDVRKLRENAKYPPAGSNYKIYVVDEVHMLSTSAFNALLKILEEPPPRLIFIFATTEPQKVLPTILSRCQRFEFRLIDAKDIISRLKYIAERENIEIDEASLYAIAQKAEGSMRDAQSLFDQARAFCGENIEIEKLADALNLIDKEFFFAVSEAIKNDDKAAVFKIADEVARRGYDLRETLSGLLEHFRNILSVKATGSTSFIQAPEKIAAKYAKEAEHFEKNDLIRAMNLIAEAERDLRFAPQPRLKFELALLKLASLGTVAELSQLIEEIKALKNPATPIAVESAPAVSEKKIPRLENSPIAAEKKSTPSTIKIEESEKSTQEKQKTESNESLSSENFGSPSVGAATLEKEWEKFARKYGKAGYGLVLLLNEEIVRPKFFDGEILLECSEKIIAEQFEEKKALLAQKAREFFGAKVKISIAYSQFETPATDDGAATENKESELDSSQINVDKSTLTPVERALIETFDARLIDEKNKNDAKA